MIAMIDLNLGNLQSVREAFRRIGAEVALVDRPELMEDARAVILPGVGAFAAGMESLREKGFEKVLRRLALDRRRPFLGICLGMQYLADESSERGRHAGLGFISGRVRRLEATMPGYRIPNMGWCDLNVGRKSVLFGEPEKDISCYFVHSYWLDCDDPKDVAATVEYSGGEITAAVEKGNIMGCQFHPEKSQEDGLDMLYSFVEYVRQA